MRGLKQAVLGYWAGISLREQRMLLITLGVALIAVFYWGGLQPLQQKTELAQTRLTSEKQLNYWVKDEADKITALRRTSTAPSISSLPLNQLLSASSSRYKVELVRLQPREDMVQVWVQPVAFKSLMSWLIYLRQQQGVDVAFLDINETDKPGIVEVKRLQFEKIGG
ncbi:type II secretion system protein M [Vibrio gallicus]|uniref:type II secretion system protein M n=1 Tax=Vibrio gallicus TaxID=190897 RepID=UPI0021C3DD5F|nr:type II secretion system protein M [Vibrio gallicus]